MRKVVLIRGDGIGPEVCDACVQVIDAAGVKLDWVGGALGAGAVPEHGTPLPPETLDRGREIGIALKGPITTPVAGGHSIVNAELYRGNERTSDLGGSLGTTGFSQRVCRILKRES